MVKRCSFGVTFGLMVGDEFQFSAKFNEKFGAVLEMTLVFVSFTKYGDMKCLTSVYSQTILSIWQTLHSPCGGIRSLMEKVGAKLMM